MDDAIVHCTRGIGIWEWASNDDGDEPDVVMACCGDVPTLETLAAVSILRERLPELKVRVVNVVDLMRLQPDTEHPHGLSDGEFDSLFTTDKPIVFAYHGYPWLIHRLTYRRANHDNMHVRGYKEEGTTTTPFDMVMLNDLDRFHLVIDVIDRVPEIAGPAAHVRQEMQDSRLRARAYGREHGEDAPETADRPGGSNARRRPQRTRRPPARLGPRGGSPACSWGHGERRQHERLGRPDVVEALRGDALRARRRQPVAGAARLNEQPLAARLPRDRRRRGSAAATGEPDDRNRGERGGAKPRRQAHASDERRPRPLRERARLAVPAP